jgi:hypothetical protein
MVKRRTGEENRHGNKSGIVVQGTRSTGTLELRGRGRAVGSIIRVHWDNQTETEGMCFTAGARHKLRGGACLVQIYIEQLRQETAS